MLSSLSNAEEFEFVAGVSGWELGDFTLVLVKNGIAQATDDISIVEVGTSGVYTFSDLPDAITVNSDRYVLGWMDPSLRWFSYSYPNRTMTPQSVVWAPTYRILPAPITMRIGDLLPTLQLEVSGLAADPTLAPVKFYMRNARTNTVIINGVLGSVSDVVAVVHPTVNIYCRNPPCTTYNAVYNYSWSGTQTATAGDYEGWFTVTFPGTLPLSSPPKDKIQIRIFN